MMTAPSDTISGTIAEILSTLEPFRGHGEVVIEGATYDAILDGLKGVRAAARAAERELGCFRTLEAARFARGVMEQVATDAAGRLVLDPEGKVIAPDFGRRS